MSWKKRAVSKSAGEKIVLETMKKEGEKDYWIIPKKLSVDAMQRITQGVDMDVELDEKEIAGKTVDEIEALVTHKIKAAKNKKSLFTEETFAVIRITFLDGIADHNFDDDTGEKIIWDEKLFAELRNYPDTLLEIFRSVMRFNYPLAVKKSGK